ncbi:hypothetical protein F4679DRAFT_586590 [Xylaria curta]|nr:hypothetical protein F4679DRAFT_586590 [Xylaria curta]
MPPYEELSILLTGAISSHGGGLRERDIGLAKILPGHWRDCIRCSLIHCDIDQLSRTPYKALSYVWGSPNAVEIIELDDENYNCINQSDTTEKNRQVAMMRDIYACAEEVLVFPGDGIDHRILKTYFVQPPESLVVFWNDYETTVSSDAFAILQHQYGKTSAGTLSAQFASFAVFPMNSI